MEYIFDRPWELGLLLAIVLALVLELGRGVAAYFKIEQVPQRKEQMGTIRDGLLVLVSLLLRLHPEHGVHTLWRASLIGGGGSDFDWHHISPCQHASPTLSRSLQATAP